MNTSQVMSAEVVSKLPKGQCLVASRSPSTGAKGVVSQGHSAAAPDPIAEIRSHIRAMVESGADADDIESAAVREMDALLLFYAKPENAEMRLAVMRKIAHQIGIQFKSHAICSERRKSWVAPNYTKGGNGHRLKALGQHLLLNFPLPGTNIRLGKATAEQIRAAATYYATDAADAAHKSRWLNAVAEWIGSGKRLTEKRARALQEQTK